MVVEKPESGMLKIGAKQRKLGKQTKQEKGIKGQMCWEKFEDVFWKEGEGR